MALLHSIPGLLTLLVFNGHVVSVVALYAHVILGPIYLRFVHNAPQKLSY